ncbi:MAG: iron-sulfur cluster assembly accessory protein [candidate division Zixibacteria bacterium]|nr:iron-sulfur cluster assembly accessory protein [candidate division Zixibacteria bacterium]
MSITITPEAMVEVKRLISQEKDENLYLRIGVAAGGCSGMSYTMAFDTEKTPSDSEYEFEGVKVLVAEKALVQLNGTILDYKGGLMGAGFSFSNPNARRSCGCGSSFSC